MTCQDLALGLQLPLARRRGGGHNVCIEPTETQLTFRKHASRSLQPQGRNITTRTGQGHVRVFFACLPALAAKAGADDVLNLARQVDVDTAADSG
ncbi:MAG: hypothetical protein H6Q99_1517 [Proteobacteria bacterium]|nr:hypothetical protein [Pseudomonadota bacterium]